MAESVVLGPQPYGPPSNASPVPPRPADLPPRRGPDLSRAEMEQIIARGESINYKGRIIAHADLLPDEAELAGNDSEKKAAYRDSIRAQITALEAAEARIDEQAARKPEPKPTLTDKPKA